MRYGVSMSASNQVVVIRVVILCQLVVAVLLH